MRQFVIALLGVSLLSPACIAADYFPPRDGAWAVHTPDQEHLDPVKLKAAIDFAVSAEMKYPAELAKMADIRDLSISIPLKYAGEAFSSPIGPLKPHAPANGIIIRHGYIVAEWGSTRQVDMTFSVTKTFLSSVAGVAFDHGLIKSVNDRVIDYVKPSPDFLLPHHHLGQYAEAGFGLDRHHVGQTLVGRPAADRQTLERAGQRPSAGGHPMEI
jgi:hypothetical protein